MKKELLVGIFTITLITGCSTKIEKNIDTNEIVNETVKMGQGFVNFVYENGNKILREILNIEIISNKKGIDIHSTNDNFFNISIFEQHNEYKDQIKTMEDIKKRLYTELTMEIKKRITMKELEVLDTTKYNEDEVKMFFNKLRNQSMEVVLQSVELERANIEYKPNGILFKISIDKNLVEKNFKDFLNYKMEKLKTNRFEMY